MKNYIVDVRFFYDGYIKVKANNEDEARKIGEETWIEEFDIDPSSSSREVVDIRDDDE